MPATTSFLAAAGSRVTGPLPPPAFPPNARARRGGLGRRLLHSGLFEALAYPHGVDRYLELVAPLLVKEARAEVIAVRHQTAKSVTLTLRPNASWQGMRAGQFVNVSVEVGGVRQTRPYSPAGSEHAADATLELTVSTHPEGRVSGHLREHARTGMIVGLGAAQGEFVLPAKRPQRVLLISGGSGVTPVMAMLRTLCDEGFAGEVGFLNYARSPELALYGAELAELAARRKGLRVARAFTRPVRRRADSRALAGRFGREHLRAVMPERQDVATFVCGPPALIEAVQAMWAQDGLPAPVVETFTPGTLSFEREDAVGTVRFAGSAREAANSGLVLLEQAEDAGLTPEHGCRMGICNTCSCRKRSGRVRNVLSGEISGARDEQIRICVSVPVGDVELEL
ncbi:MAG TPA: ferredoxin reductase [Solirubrobacteraceae bacterium]|nr:ferredoxin reductase [Solirubrobacteraceae bacterium]